MIALAAFLGGSIAASVGATDAVLRLVGGPRLLVRARDAVAERLAIPPWRP